MEETQQNDQKMEFRALCEEFRANNQIPPEKFDLYQVKRGLRNPDGTGVMAGLTLICNVHGYLIDDAERIPDKGILTYRGINVEDIVEGCRRENRFGFEEVAWLLLFGKQPTRSQLEGFSKLLNSCRELPEYFAEDMIIKAPSKNIMNKLSRSILSLYSYDDSPEDMRIENEMRIALDLIAKMPILIDGAYQAKRHKYDNMSLIMHQLRATENTAESILSLIRHDRTYTKKEAQLLDTLLAIHADHGGGNNSTFACRVATSSGTDAYAAYASAVNSLKGRRHGGANIKVIQMLDDIKANVGDYDDDTEIKEYLRRLIRKQAGDRSGCIRIMSVHKSKGLEFPIVIVAGMGKLFNTQDVKGSIVIHPELGVGMDVIDLKKRTKAPTLLKKVIQKQVAVENLGEEMRVLYVAMTRAKEKLILMHGQSWKHFPQGKKQHFFHMKFFLRIRIWTGCFLRHPRQKVRSELPLLTVWARLRWREPGKRRMN